MSKTLQQRFDEKWELNSETGCWDWTAGRCNSGYGQIREGGRETSHKGAHRVSYELHVGEIPDGLSVCHRCDRPCCVNPEHLFLGTHVDNMRDMAEKGRSQKGESNCKAKLTHGEVELIREALDRLPYGGLTFLARWFGVAPSAICHIRKERRWA